MSTERVTVMKNSNLIDYTAHLAAELANNHAKFESFGWSTDAQPDDKENWAIIYLSNRDSGLADKSNEAVILKALAPWTGWHKDGDTVETISHNHWAVGYVDGILIRVYTYNKCFLELTDAFRTYAELHMRLADYPLLDEDDYSEREYTATVESILQVGKNMVCNDAPESWPGEAFSWFYENNQSAVESTDDQ